MNIGNIYTDDYPESVARWCNERGNCYISEIEPQDGHRRFQIVAIPEPTEEELAQQALNQAKAERADAVSKITVEVDGLLFDGDETSQDRMARAVANARAKADMVNAQRKADWMASWGDADSADGIPEEPAYDDYLEYETTWILATNEVRTDIKISQLAQAGTLAGQAQTELWTKPYEVTDGAEAND